MLSRKYEHPPTYWRAATILRLWLVILNLLVNGCAGTTSGEGVKSTLFRVLGSSPPLTAAEIWEKAEVRSTGDKPSHGPPAVPSIHVAASKRP